MSSQTRSSDTSAGISYVELTFALVGGATAWLLRLIVNSSLVEYACRVGATWPIWVTTAVAALVGVAALVSSRRLHTVARDTAQQRETVRWLGLLGMGFNVLAVAGIVLETLPVLFLDICRAAST